MRTIRELVGSAKEQLQQTGDDLKVQDNQLYLWATWFVNKYINAQISTQDSGSYITVLPNVLVQNASLTVSPNIVKARKYSLLPQSIFDLHLDRGIEAITYPYNFLDTAYMHLKDVRFQRTNIQKISKLYMSPYEVPTPQNPYFYLYGKYVGYLGIEVVPVTSVEMWLKTPFDPFTAHSIDDYIPILDQYGSDIAKNIFEMGRFELMMPGDRINDASSHSPGEVPQSRAVSLNQEINTDPNAVQS